MRKVNQTIERFVFIHYTHVTDGLSSSRLYHDPLLHALLRSIVCMLLFCCVVSFFWLSFLWSLFVCGHFYFLAIFVFVCLFPIPVWLDALPVCAVTSCPVLEFELRKAKETIQALRANLTQAAGVAYFQLLLFPQPSSLRATLLSLSLFCCFNSTQLLCIDRQHPLKLIFIFLPF